MKIHPIPTPPKKRNLTLRHDLVSPQTEPKKKLRRLPHIFAKVLELPFRSDADVSVEETEFSFRFVVPDTDVGDGVWADTVEIHPGVTKIVVRSNDVVYVSIDELELDVWRFRLPIGTKPEMATASYVDGDLVVLVPKGRDEEGEEEEWGLGW
ncbi:hypothetical protein Droror1_Dr00022181 [Drosera rotundifolia]